MATSISVDTCCDEMLASLPHDELYDVIAKLYRYVYDAEPFNMINWESCEMMAWFRSHYDQDKLTGEYRVRLH
jgi:hypothetical protein